MNDEKHNLTLILISLSFFIGATIEYGHGSVFIGILLSIIGFIILLKLRIKRLYAPSSPIYALIGIFLLVMDIAYNHYNLSNFGTLDTMIFLLSFSMIGYSNTKYANIQEMSVFFIWMSIPFITLFLIFFTFLPVMNIPFMTYFDHYFVMMPSFYIVKFLGVPIQVVSMSTVNIKGMIIGVSDACSGLYSMFLLISILTGFFIANKIKDRKKLFRLTISAAIISMIANISRISTLFIIAYLYGIKTMLTVHVFLGWILFAIISYGLILILSWTKVGINK